MLDNAIYWITGGHTAQIWMPWVLMFFGCVIMYTVVKMYKGN